MLPLHEDHRACAHAQQALAEDTALEELRQGSGADRRALAVLAAVPRPQEQAALDQNHSGALSLSLPLPSRIPCPPLLCLRQFSAFPCFALAFALSFPPPATSPAFVWHTIDYLCPAPAQYLIRMRRLALRSREKTVTLPTRKRRVEKIREARAESAANLEKTIEEELLARCACTASWHE